VIFPLKIQIKLQKTRLWKGKSVQGWFFFIFNSSKTEFVPCKIRFIFWVSPILYWVHTCAYSTCHTRCVNCDICLHFQLKYLHWKTMAWPLCIYTLLIEPSEGFWTQTMIATVFYVMFFFSKFWRSWEFCGCGLKIFLIGRGDMADRRTGKEGAITKVSYTSLPVPLAQVWTHVRI
jgi:hypothetical protein